MTATPAHVMTTDTTNSRVALYRVEIEGKLFGAYTDEGEAESLVKALRGQGMDAKVVPKASVVSMTPHDVRGFGDA